MGVYFLHFNPKPPKIAQNDIFLLKGELKTQLTFSQDIFSDPKMPENIKIWNFIDFHCTLMYIDSNVPLLGVVEYIPITGNTTH